MRHKEPLQQGVITTVSPPSVDAECGSTVDSEVTTSDSSVKQETEKRSAPQPEPLPRKDVQPTVVTKYNVVQLLQNGKTMRWVRTLEKGNYCPDVFVHVGVLYHMYILLLCLPSTCFLVLSK